MDDADFIAAIGPLTCLSLQRCRPNVMPKAPTNEERRRAWRDRQPVELHNAHPWDYLNQERSK